MDKTLLPYNEQRKFFSKCRDAYKAKACGGEERYQFAIFGHLIEVSFPKGSSILAAQIDFFPGKTHLSGTPEINIYIADNSCPGFSVPHAPFERFRFTRRGDILGFEDAPVKGMYFSECAALLIVDTEEDNAFILFRNNRLVNYDSYNKAMVAVLSLLLKSREVFFLPVKILTESNSAVFVLSALPEAPFLNIDTLAKKRNMVIENWAIIKYGITPLALPWPTNNIDRGKISTPSEVRALISNEIDDISSKEIYDHMKIHLAGYLGLYTLSLLPFSEERDLTRIECLFLQLPLVSYQVMKKYLSRERDKTVLLNTRKKLTIRQDTDVFPRLSVIIPAYNSARFLKYAVMSVMALNYSNLEIIVIDDGSSDDTSNVVSSMAVNVQYQYQNNAGPSSARNLGLDVSRGELLIFLDADDLLNLTGFYSLLLTLLRHPEVDVVTGYGQKFHADSNEKYTFVDSPHNSFPYYIGAAIFRRDAFEKNGIFDHDLLMCEDIDWFVRAEEKGMVILRKELISLFVRRHNSNITKDSEMNNLQLLNMLKKKAVRNT
ncbi:MAG: glycosyltransferase family A protein [Bacteroidales bacterium]|nr:glycosyltransferase family A protein [Bacteroidales bacterium]